MAIWCLSFEEQDEIIRLYKTKKYTQQGIGEHFNISASTVNTVLASHGLTRKRNQFTVEQTEIVRICESLGITLTRLEAVKRKYDNA